ncbi:MAG: helix-hairpin-helix domain-containing protein, partial [Gaiellaceae bacterium]
HIDPIANNLFLGRFLNRDMASVPDIDLDFPRDIRERLIAEVITRYGHEHAALVAAFPTFKARMAIRELGKALALPEADLTRLARLADGWSSASDLRQELVRLPDGEAKLRSPRWRALVFLAAQAAGLPRHLSQHSGGMVVSAQPLVELVPVVPAAMRERQICQWDKNSCADAGFVKIDLLGLGMLSAVEECVDLIARTAHKSIDLSRIDFADPAVYAEIQDADTVGTFQIESRAQMQSLLQTRPENLDDLTVQVALIRPGPVSGGAVHPYVQHRRARRADPDFVPPYDHPLLEPVLGETLGVVVFQEQVLGVATALAGFTVGEAEGLRRAMSRKRSREAVEAFHGRFVEGALGRGVPLETAKAVFQKLNGFAAFGFPKSHAAAFGLLAYQSAWLRHHYPREFLCALLNAQPMGFYPPASVVRDAQRREVEVRGPDVNRSAARCALEGEGVRIGLEYVRSLGEEEARAVVAERERGGPFAGVRDLAQRTELDRARLEALVASGVCDSFGGGRRKLLWELGFVPRVQTVPGSGGEEQQLALPLDPTAATPGLREQTPWERMLADYRTTSLSVGTHPLALLREHLPEGTLSSRELAAREGGGQVAVAGMAVARQRPATANGVVFMLLEDEFGQVNLIVPPAVYERFRPLVRAEPLLLARGKFERLGRNRNVVVRELESLGPLARRCAEGADVFGSLPAAHHFGHR